MSQARIIRLERMKGKDGWDKISEPRLINEEFVDDYE
jgi:hypothetical protein